MLATRTVLRNLHVSPKRTPLPWARSASGALSPRAFAQARCLCPAARKPFSTSTALLQAVAPFRNDTAPAFSPGAPAGGSFEIPVIDFASFLRSAPDDPHAKVRVANQLTDAFKKSGFVYLKGHGIATEQILDAFKAVRFLPPSVFLFALLTLGTIICSPPPSSICQCK